MRKNGELTQQGNSNDMIFPIDKIIAYVSQFVTLKIGDLIYTGTPAGVGAIEIGDTLEAFIGEKLMLTTSIKQEGIEIVFSILNINIILGISERRNKKAESKFNKLAFS